MLKIKDYSCFFSFYICSTPQVSCLNCEHVLYEKALLVQHSARLLVSLKGITMQRKRILNTKNPLLLWPERRLFDLDPYLLCACILLAVNSVFGIAETHGDIR